MAAPLLYYLAINRLVWTCVVKNADLEAFGVRLTNNIEAKHCTVRTLYSIFNEKCVWRPYLMGIHAKTKTLGSIFARIYAN